jgi:hypothetical protein
MLCHSDDIDIKSLKDELGNDGEGLRSIFPNNWSDNILVVPVRLTWCDLHGGQRLCHLLAGRMKSRLVVIRLHGFIGVMLRPPGWLQAGRTPLVGI